MIRKRRQCKGLCSKFESIMVSVEVADRRITLSMTSQVYFTHKPRIQLNSQET